MSERLRIEYISLTELKKWPRNPKQHDVPRIGRSVNRFGFNDPIEIDEKSGLMVAGHGRVESLLEKQGKGEPPPKHVIATDGDWLVPVVRGISFPNRKEAQAYLVANNQLTIKGDWDDKLLAETVLELPSDLIDVTGFAGAELRYLERVRDDEDEDPPAPPAPQDPTTKLGDLWLLGKHRVLCGDSTNENDVKHLIGAAKISLIVTDPPYSVNLDQSWRDKYMTHQRAPGTSNNDRFQMDASFDWLSAFRLQKAPILYCWHAGLYAGKVAPALEELGYHIKQQIIWVKTHFAYSRQHYHWKHECCFYAVMKGEKAPWYGGYDQTTVWEAASPKQINGPHDEEKMDHPTQKPLVLFTTPIRNHLNEGECCYDPFLGSGTALIAAEKGGAVCYGMDLEPKYVDVSVKRWEAFTGKKAERVPAAISTEITPHVREEREQAPQLH
ncbi:MAG: DNA methyltransferase [archaeon]